MKIFTDDHPALRQKSTPVTASQMKALGPLLDEMEKTCIKADGVGLAAPQVGINLSFFIMLPGPNKRYPKAPHGPREVVFNPKIIKKSTKKISDWEGCLSLPGRRAEVPRYASIQVQYYNEHGKLIEKTYEGFLARLFLHEYDHLRGVLYSDYLTEPLPKKGKKK